MTYQLPMKDGEVDIDRLSVKMHMTYYDTYSLVQALASHYEARGAEKEREACALVAAGFDTAVNSKAMTPFVDADVVFYVCDRDEAIAEAIRARGASEQMSGERDKNDV